MFGLNLESPFKNSFKNNYNFQFTNKSFIEEVNRKESIKENNETQETLKENKIIQNETQTKDEIHKIKNKVKINLQIIINYINVIYKEILPNYEIKYEKLNFKSHLIHYGIVLLLIILFMKPKIIFMEFIIAAVLLSIIFLNKIYLIIKLKLNEIDFQNFYEIDKFHFYLFLITIKPLFILYPLYIIIDKESNIGSLLLITSILYCAFLYIIQISRFHEKLKNELRIKKNIFKNIDYLCIFIAIFFIYFILTYSIIIK